MNPLAGLKRQTDRKQGFLTRLRKDVRGNTFAMVGAAMVPLVGLIGSGVDMSRAYMAKARLQNACDAASLAGRRIMSGSEVSQAVIDESNRFFDFNFPSGTYGTDDVDVAVTASTETEGTVRIEASTEIPTGVMFVFGKKFIDVSVNCEASQNYVNTDVMLVLDTTGSMLCRPEESGSCGRTSEISTSRIAALREAVMALYEELEPVQDELEEADMRLRYGIVPYTSTVNVGRLLDAADIANTAPYQTRLPVYWTTSSQQVSGQNSTWCNNQAQARTSTVGPATRKTVSRSNGVCTITTTTWSYSRTGTFDHWHYKQHTLNTAQFKLGSASNPARPLGQSETNTWSGCIEERATDPSINGGTSYTIPEGATDLNIDLIPEDDASRWIPHWPEVIYNRGSSDTSTAERTTTETAPTGSSWRRYTSGRDDSFYTCPSAAAELQPWTESDLQDYVDGLVAVGGTYHDIGMIWGTRLISSQGVFGDDNPETFNSMPVNKHIIFMTDGDMSPNANIYGAYAWENKDRRVSGTAATSTLTLRHRQRFRMACNAARGKNVTIWVIMFGDDPNAGSEEDLLDCAGGRAEQVSTISNRDELIERFREIGKNIGALRLTK